MVAKADEAAETAVAVDPIRTEPGPPQPAFVPLHAENVRIDLADNKLIVTLPNTGQSLGEISWSPLKSLAKAARSHDEALEAEEA